MQLSSSAQTRKARLCTSRSSSKVNSKTILEKEAQPLEQDGEKCIIQISNGKAAFPPNLAIL